MCIVVFLMKFIDGAYTFLRITDDGHYEKAIILCILTSSQFFTEEVSQEQ